MFIWIITLQSHYRPIRLDTSLNSAVYRNVDSSNDNLIKSMSLHTYAKSSKISTQRVQISKRLDSDVLSWNVANNQALGDERRWRQRERGEPLSSLPVVHLRHDDDKTEQLQSALFTYLNAWILGPRLLLGQGQRWRPNYDPEVGDTLSFCI